MDPVIRFKNVTKEFTYWHQKPSRELKSVLNNLLQLRVDTSAKTKVPVLNDVSFDIFPGEFVGIMGKNGAGKSTILKLIGGIYEPTRGTIEVNQNIAPLIELGAGFQGDLSGYENIFLNAAILGYGRKHVLSIVDQIIDFSELGSHIRMPVRNYSSGMLVRLGFSVAVFLDAPIVLLDEVLGVGDAKFVKKSSQKIRQMHEEGRTLILVSHDPEQIKLNCTRGIVIQSGRVSYDGPPEGVGEAYLKSL